MSGQDKLITRREFLKGSSTALTAMSGLTIGCNTGGDSPSDKNRNRPAINTKAFSWWHEEGFIVHETVDTKRINKGIIRACINGLWREFKVIDLPERFVNWSFKTRVSRLRRMLSFGGLDPRDLAGSHNACVATYGGPSRDSAISLNTAYKGMGFAIHTNRIAKTTESIIEEQNRIERDFRGNPTRAIQAKVRFLAEFYSHISSFDRTKQVSLELFTTPKFHTHTFLNMMINPIASASFLAFPTFEIRAVPQLLHPKNPGLSEYERDLIAYTNTIHDFIHSGHGERMTCVYHVIELFDDTPNEDNKGRRIA